MNMLEENIIYIIDQKKKLAINEDDFNEETVKDFGLNLDKETLQLEKSIEVGDIYSLGYKYSEALDFKYTKGIKIISVDSLYDLL